MKKVLKNKEKNLKLTTLGFTLVELLGVIIILGVIALITFPIIDKSIKSSKEKALNQIINNIEEAAYNYSISNDIGNQNFYNKIELSTLVSSGILKDNIINPVTDEKMQGCVLYKWIEEYKQYEFKYDEECSVKTIGQVVLEQFPYLETNGNGCIISGDNNYSYMGGCYIKGNPNNNYIWYSGFLWRIMGINADGTIRLITDENVTTIPWGGEKNDGSGGEITSFRWEISHINQWLNNYFYIRLKGNNIIVEQDYCSQATEDELSNRSLCNEENKYRSKIGLISLDEYNLADGINSYLNIGQNSRTITPQDTSNTYIMSEENIYCDSISYLYGIRPVLNVLSTSIITSGNGKIVENWNKEEGPYILNDDKSINVNGILNKRATNGEYVLFADKVYRIVEIYKEGYVKIILDDYYKENNQILYTAFGTTTKFIIDDGIGEKLNTDVLNWLVDPYDEINKNKLVSSYKWNQKYFKFGNNYEISLDDESPDISTIAQVGLIRIGEILSSQSWNMLYTNSCDSYWTLSMYDDSSGWAIYSSDLQYYESIENGNSIRPVIILKSNLEIVNGNGTWSKPYQI